MSGMMRPGLFLIFVVLASSAAAEPPTLGQRDPSNPWQKVPGTIYRPITGDVRSFKPVEPLPWGDVNRRVTPKPGAGEGEKK